jgi:hypothetical protein
MLNAFINNRETYKSLQSQINEVNEAYKNLQSQINEVNETLNTLKQIKTTYDAKILELDDKIKFQENIFKYKLWSCKKYHEDRHIPVNDFLRLLEMDMIKMSHSGHEYTSLFMAGGYEYFEGWISRLSSEEYYRISKAVRQYKKYFICFDNLIQSDFQENQLYNYLYVLEQLHVAHSNKRITSERFEICRKTVLLLKEDGLLH